MSIYLEAMMRTRGRLTKVSGLAAAMLMLAAPAAMAYSYNITAMSPNGGTGTADGTINFTGTRQYNFAGLLKDGCPGDNFGQGLYFSNIINNNTRQATGVKVRNQSNCPSQTSYSDNVYWTQNMRGVVVVVQLEDNGQFAGYFSASPEKDNPYT